MALFASLLPLLCWFAYNNGIFLVERRYPSMSSIMSQQRRRWVANAAIRETPVDAILAGNLMGSVSFLASTTALLVLASVAAFGQVNTITTQLQTLTIGAPYSRVDVELHFACMLAIFVLAFFAFTLSLRQFNHFCIMLGAMGQGADARLAEIDAIATLNSSAARNFNNGLRAFYFAVPMIAWFAGPWVGIAGSLLTVGFIVHREFLSGAHRIAMSLAAAGKDPEARTESRMRPAAKI
jgi:uncharacterized membrane protein